MGILPAKFHHKTSSNDAKSVKVMLMALAGTATAITTTMGAINHHRFPSGAAGPSHSNAVSPSEIALGNKWNEFT